MKFYTQTFYGNGAQPHYDGFANVLRATSGDKVKIIRIEDEDLDMNAAAKLHGTYFQNARKTRHHAELIERHADGECVALLDADMFVLRSIDPELQIALGDCDIAITYRSAHSMYVFNSGLFVTRVSSLTRALHAAWVECCNAFLAEPKLYHKYSRNYGGINQSSLACVLERPEFRDIKIARLATLEWNAIAADHASAEKNQCTRIVHVLGPLRRDVLSSRPKTSLGKIWCAAHADCIHNFC